MPLSAQHVGSRVVVRAYLPGETGPTGGPAMTDTLGILERFDVDALSVRKEDGTLVTVRQSDLVTGKPVPPRESIRARISPYALQRICSLGWRDEVERVGDWELRYGGGFTGRANSVLVCDEPGHGLVADDALAEVVERYRTRGLTACAMTPVGSAGEQLLAERGWVRVAGKPVVLVMIASAAHVRRAARGHHHDVRLLDRRDEVAHLQAGTDGVDPAVVERVLASGDAVTFAAVGEPAYAVGRGVVTGDWLGISAVRVDEAHRRQGLASTVLEELVGWGIEQGARSVYLQVEADNDPAIALYEGYGFGVHHEYVYYVAPVPGHRGTCQG